MPRRRHGRRIGGLLWVGATAILWVALTMDARGQQTPGQLLDRLLDPTALGMAAYPPSTLNRKLTADTLRYMRGVPVMRTFGTR